MIKIYTQGDFEKSEPLNDENIHIWVLDLKKCGFLLSTADSVLCESEKAYISRFVRPVDRERSLLPRVLLHNILSEYTGMNPEEIAIAKKETGQPYAVDIPEVNISISHSGERAVTAVALNRRIGVDIEKIQYIPEYIRIAEKFFCPEESEKIIESGSYRQFFKYWTAKEAFVKAVGEGLRRDFSSFYADLQKNMIYDRMYSDMTWNLSQMNGDYSISCVSE